jgi:hypothetical protein
MPEKKTLKATLISPEARGLIEEEASKARPAPPEPKEEPQEEPTVTVAFRWPQSLAQGLLDYCHERKRSRRRPWTHQEISAEAMREYLAKHANK